MKMTVMGKYLSTGILASFTLLLSGCISPPDKPPLSEQVFAEAERSEPQQNPVPDYIQDALLKNAQQTSRSSNTSERFDIAVQNMPAQAFFMGLMSDADINVVTHPEVSGNISLELTDVTVDEVLNVVRDVYGFEYRVNGRIYTIYPRKLRTEVFPINYIDVTRVGVSDTSVSIGEITSNSGRSGATGSGGGGSNTSSTHNANLLGMGETENSSRRSGSQGIGPGSRVQTLNRTNFWQTVETTVKSIVGATEEGRTVMVNPQAGLVVVTAMPAELGAVRNFLTRSELIVKRQVVLEAKILEVQLNEGFEAGINWNSIQGQLQYSKNVASSTSPAEILSVAENGPELFASIFRVADIRDLLSLLETQGSVQVLSSPRVSTVNNQKAVIRVGTDEFFVTGISNNTTASAGATTTSPEVELASFFSGISLDVTPQISEDGHVILHIHPIVSDVTDQQKEITIGDYAISVPLALREIRESDSIVRARSGQVIVLGGLMQESRRDLNAKRPGLGDIPLLNAFFRTKNRGSSKTELVILLKPIVVGEDTWREEIRMHRRQSGPLPDGAW